MKLYDNWKTILRKSWNLRLVFIAGLLSGGEVVLPLMGDYFPPALFAGLSFFFCAGAFIARLIAQKDL